MSASSCLIDTNDGVLVTGANGFIGTYLVEALLRRGFRKVRCLIRHSANPRKLEDLAHRLGNQIEIFRGNLLSPEDCAKAVRDVAVSGRVIISGGKHGMEEEIVSRYAEVHRKVWRDARQGKDAR